MKKLRDEHQCNEIDVLCHLKEENVTEEELRDRDVEERLVHGLLNPKTTYGLKQKVSILEKDKERYLTAYLKSEKKIDNQKKEINRLNTIVKKQKEFIQEYQHFQNEKTNLISELADLKNENFELKKTNRESAEMIENLRSELFEVKKDHETLKSKIGDSSHSQSMVDIARSVMIEVSNVLDQKLGTTNAGNLVLNEALTQNEALRREIDEMKECKICNEMFDNDERQPVKANCVHVYYCRACLESIATDGTGKCPTCRVSFRKKDLVSVNLNFV